MTLESVLPPGKPVAIGMGSNLGDPIANLRLGVRALGKLLENVYASAVYETVPLYVPTQPLFLNACCTGCTLLSPRRLLTELQEIEERAGRVRKGGRYGPRILDLDLLLYGNRVIRRPDLVVPHPHLRERAFVLIPLREIAPAWRVPGDGATPAGTVAQLAAAVEAKGVVRTKFRLKDD